MTTKTFRNRFKKFGGEFVPDVVEYLKEFIKAEPEVTISVGCDSIQKRRRTQYAVTIMLYNIDLRNGAHVIFFRENQFKIRDNNERLYKEAQYVYEVAQFLDTELQGTFIRKDLTQFERKRYKYHLLKCAGEYSHVTPHNEEGVISSLTLSQSDLALDFKLVDVHVDFNPFEGTLNEKGMHKNKSQVAYKSYVPWLRGMGFRTWAKPLAFGATSAADLLLQG